MDILILIVPITLLICILAIAGIFWSLKSKQFDDLKGNAARILFDDEDK